MGAMHSITDDNTSRRVNTEVSFDELKEITSQPNSILISTLPETMQECLISGTIPCGKEEYTINRIVEEKRKREWSIIIYGRNCLDVTPIKKQKQLLEMGFARIHVYVGGLFEWLLLQEVYGDDNFSTTQKNPTNILRYCAKTTTTTTTTSTSTSTDYSRPAIESMDGGLVEVLSRIVRIR